MNVSRMAAPTASSTQNTPPNKHLEAAQRLEAQFLAEMLKSAGLGESRGAFGGGAGEEHFASFIVEAHANTLARRGGIGLAELILQSLERKSLENH